MDRDGIVRSRRRDQALEALEEERDRERALEEQVGAILVEEDGPRVDEEAFARMEATDVALVRELLHAGGGFGAEDLDEGLEEELLHAGGGFGEDDGDDDWAGQEDEIERLRAEIARCRERQRALERYIEALGA